MGQEVLQLQPPRRHQGGPWVQRVQGLLWHPWVPESLVRPDHPWVQAVQEEALYRYHLLDL